MLTTPPRKEGDMEKWSAQESDRTFVLGYWAGRNGLYVWVYIIGGVQLESDGRSLLLLLYKPQNVFMFHKLEMVFKSVCDIKPDEI